MLRLASALTAHAGPLASGAAAGRVRREVRQPPLQKKEWDWGSSPSSPSLGASPQAGSGDRGSRTLPPADPWQVLGRVISPSCECRAVGSPSLRGTGSGGAASRSSCDGGTAFTEERSEPVWPVFSSPGCRVTPACCGDPSILPPTHPGPLSFADSSMVNPC